jgi:hypothetical protein
MSQTVPVYQYSMPFGRLDGKTNYATREYVVANGVTINNGDFVYFSSGTVTNASVNGARLAGMAMGNVTGNSSGTNTVLVTIDPFMRYLIKSTTSLTVSNNTNSNIGQYFDITGATGAQTVSNTGTTLGAFVLVDVPGTATFPNTGLNIPSTTTVGLFVLVNSFLLPYVAS